MSDVKTDIIELQELNREISRLSEQLKILRERKNYIEGSIINYLETTQQPGVKFKNVTVIQEEKNYRKPKKKKEKYSAAVNVLKGYGVQDPEEAYNKVINAMRGSPHAKPKLKLKELDA